MKFKIELEGESEPEFRGAKRSFSSNRTKFGEAFEKLLDLWFEIDYQTSPSEIERVVKEKFANWEKQYK